MVWINVWQDNNLISGALAGNAALNGLVSKLFTTGANGFYTLGNLISCSLICGADPCSQ